MNNSLVQKQPSKLSFTDYITNDKVKSRIFKTLDGESGKRFISAITSAVSSNPALQECSPASVINAALLGESLKLSPSPQLGHYYIVPYKKKDRNGNIIDVTGQFQLGYKGYLQLAYRSGCYTRLTVMEVKQGELIRYDPFNEIFEARYNTDGDRDSLETIGYVASFELKSGLKKVLYWSKDKMLRHADTYSQAFSASNYELFVSGKVAQKDMWKYSSFWYKDFDGMAKKTMLRQLISKSGIMSIETEAMNIAMEKDMSVIGDDGMPQYVDSPEYTAPVVEAEYTEAPPPADVSADTADDDPLA